MTDKHTPAFPCHPNTVEPLYEGMTLRDYFAASYLANKWSTANTYEITAKTAYAVADAMLKVRNG